MYTRSFILCLALMPVLTGAVARADQTEHWNLKHLQCTVSGSGIAGVETNLDTNGDGISAGVTQNIVNCGSLRFFSQNESEYLAPVPATGNCPAGSTREFTLLQSHSVGIEEKTGDQLFTEYTSGTLCLKLPDFTFTFTGTLEFTGGTGRFSGATGTADVQLAGKYLVTGRKGPIFGALSQFTGTSTETLVLPKDDE